MKQSKKEQKLADLIYAELATGEGQESSELQANREAALAAYYTNEDSGTTAPARLDPANTPATKHNVLNSVHSTDIADMTQAVLAQLTPMLSTDALVTFEAKGQDDEEAARAESDAVNHIIIEQNQGFLAFQAAIKDALLLRNCALKVYVEEKQHVRKINLAIDDDTMMQPDEVAAILQPRAANEQRFFVSPKKVNNDKIQRNDYVKVVTTVRRMRMVPVPIDNLVYEANATSSDIQEFRFFAERLTYTRSELVEFGHSKDLIYSLNASDALQDTAMARARNATGATNSVAETTDQDSIDCHEAYVLIDLNGDGISERYRVLYADKTVLEYEEIELIPYTVGTAFIRSHRLVGESLYDHLKQTQTVKTAFLRQWLHNAAFLTSGRIIGDPTRVNFADVVNGSSVIKTNDPNYSPTVLPQLDIGQSMLSALQYQDKQRTERGGAALDMVSADMQLVGETAHGIERQYTQRELLVSFMGRNLAETLIRPIYLIMHYYLRNFSNAPLELKVAGEWTQADPSQWQHRDRCKVKAGMSSGERAATQRTLQQVMQLQTQAMQSGLAGQLTDVSSMYNAATDWLTMAGIDNPDSYLINPKSPQAQQAAQQAAQQQQQQQAAQQQLIQQQAQLEMLKLQQKAKDDEDTLAYKYWSDQLSAEVDEAKIVATGTIDLEKAHIHHNSAPNGASHYDPDNE